MVENNGRDRLLVTYEKANELIDKQIIKGQELLNYNIDYSEALKNHKDKYKRWTNYNVELLKKIFTDNSLAEEYDTLDIFIGSSNSQWGWGNNNNINNKIEEYYSEIKENINNLKTIKEKIELYDEVEREIKKIEFQENKLKRNKKIFIVHGHDNGVKQSVARVIEKLGLEVIILHERANKGKTIIEKLEGNSDVGFVVVLLTPDDLGRTKNEEELKSRARQNVIAELGYFVGKLGRERVCPVYVEGVEIPSDFDGVIYTLYDNSGSWKFELVKELKAVGYEVDANSLID